MRFPIAVVATTAFTLAFCAWADKAAQWPLETFVLQNVLFSQLDCGAWAKNIDKTKPFGEQTTKTISSAKGDKEAATIDNNATTDEIRYLLRYYGAKKDKRAKTAALRGIDWLLSVQLDNGGWAQFPHRNKGYWTQITFNDDAMTNVLELMKDASQGKGDFAALDKSRSRKCAIALEKGILCILKCQILVDGKPTVWCQQHDRETLLPANGRAYELPSFCSQESARIVLFLMSIEKPSKEVREAIEGAVQWFEKTRLPDGTWARFYDLKECKPFFCDRSGVPKRDISEISAERRRGYSWFNARGAEVLKRFAEWRKKNR